jgi:hypothetical protein
VSILLLFMLPSPLSYASSEDRHVMSEAAAPLHIFLTLTCVPIARNHRDYRPNSLTVYVVFRQCLRHRERERDRL